jgi:hypothetical protein
VKKSTPETSPAEMEVTPDVKDEKCESAWHNKPSVDSPQYPLSQLLTPESSMSSTSNQQINSVDSLNSFSEPDSCLSNNNNVC